MILQSGETLLNQGSLFLLEVISLLNLKKYIVLSYLGILFSAIIESTIIPKLIIRILQ